MVQCRQPEATQHVSYMWRSSNNKPEGAKRSSIAMPRPKASTKYVSILATQKTNTHGLQAHCQKSIGPKPTTTSNTTRQPHLVQHNKRHNKHEGLWHACIAMPTTTPCTKQDKTMAIHTSVRSRAANLLSKTDGPNPTLRGNTTCDPHAVQEQQHA